jgi:hypothetical protein
MAQLLACSFIGIRGVPRNAPPSQECTDSNRLPWADTASAIIVGGAGAAAIVANETKAEAARETWATNTGLVLVGLAIPLAVSAWWGFHNVTRCREARGEAGPS